jgi:hypothetical protein
MTFGHLSLDELRGLAQIGATQTCASYWQDGTMKLYRSLGLVETDGHCIRLTDAGRDLSRAPGHDKG